ncbi:MAG: D-aminoacylase [Gammaproteobacteria bacterium]|nr:D-aminoacylase [Gammaproteobacteria bacterium]MDH5619147.1 D-aminoacylase [Gammaproteobacteria bacterium]
MKRTIRNGICTVLAAILFAACGSPQPPEHFDVIIRGGDVYDGLGGAPVKADVALTGERIAKIGDLSSATAGKDIDATGLAVSPGFINMLSWATESLIEDGRGMSDIKQGVTLEVMGEGWSMGPLNDELRALVKSQQSDIQYDISWSTLGGYLEFLEDKGVSPNVASYVGAATLRIMEVGFDNVKATEEQLARMQDHVRLAMREGAIGVGSSLIYAPGNFADTDELVALVAAAAEFDGRYISHIRSEGNRLEESVEELIHIARVTGAPAEIYHLKAGGRSNWHKAEKVFARVEAARAEGLAITADMYTYTAGATGLDASMPLWVQEGGDEAWFARLEDPAIRARVKEEMMSEDTEWENLGLHAGPDGVLFIGFRNPDLRHLIGKTLAEVAELRGTSPADAAIDLVIEDRSRVSTVYFLMSEENVAKTVAQPWVSFGSDAEASAPEGVFLNSSTHPRAYGTFARVLGKYARDEEVITLQDGIRKMTSLPATNLGIRERGQLKAGYFADVVVFDPARVQDHATFEEPLQYATGVQHVFVNGEQVLEDGEHTGATPGRVVRGPGWTGWVDSD